MKPQSVFNIAIIPMLMALMAGCATTPESSVDGAGDEAASASAQGSEQHARSFGLNNNELLLDELNNPDSPLSNRTIYFDYDSSAVKPEFRDVLAAHGQFLANNVNRRMRLEGHTDERGTREYNLALGENRAIAVRQILLLHGALGNQIEVISFGEEQPAVISDDENSWQENRRVKIVY